MDLAESRHVNVWRNEVEAFGVGCAVTLQTLAFVLKAREHGARYAVRPARGRTPERC